FLTTTSKEGLGESLFADWRAAGLTLGRGTVLVAGKNFGCGSSPEHAGRALMGWGLRPGLAPRFARLLPPDTSKNGLLPIALDVRIDDGAEVAVDLEKQTVSLPFAIDPFARTCLLAGQDEMGYLLARLPQVEEYERRRL